MSTTTTTPLKTYPVDNFIKQLPPKPPPSRTPPPKCLPVENASNETPLPKTSPSKNTQKKPPPKPRVGHVSADKASAENVPRPHLHLKKAEIVPLQTSPPKRYPQKCFRQKQTLIIMSEHVKHLNIYIYIDIANFHQGGVLGYVSTENVPVRKPISKTPPPIQRLLHNRLPRKNEAKRFARNASDEKRLRPQESPHKKRLRRK